MPTATKPPQKVSLYSLPDLKAATDEAIAPYLSSLPAPYTFTQDHTLTNVRLALGYSAVLIAGALFYLDYKHGWDVTKPYTLPACIVYFLLNGIMTLWVWSVEAGTVFEGRREGGQKLKLTTRVTKPRPEYVLQILYASPKGDTTWQDVAVSIPFNRLFNVHGYLQKKELHKFLAREVEVIGLADPKAKAATMEWEREAGVDGGDEKSVMSGALAATAAAAGDTIEIDVGGRDDGEALATGQGVNASAGTTPAKRGPGRPKKRT